MNIQYRRVPRSSVGRSCDTRVYYTDFELKPYYWPDIHKEPPYRVLLERVVGIPGVEDAYMSRYSLRIEIGCLFTWSEVHPNIMEALEDFRRGFTLAVRARLRKSPRVKRTKR